MEPRRLPPGTAVLLAVPYVLRYAFEAGGLRCLKAGRSSPCQAHGCVGVVFCGSPLLARSSLDPTERSLLEPSRGAVAWGKTYAKIPDGFAPAGSRRSRCSSSPPPSPTPRPASTSPRWPRHLPSPPPKPRRLARTHRQRRGNHSALKAGGTAGVAHHVDVLRLRQFAEGSAPPTGGYALSTTYTARGCSGTRRGCGCSGKLRTSSTIRSSWAACPPLPGL